MQAVPKLGEVYVHHVYWGMPGLSGVAFSSRQWQEGGMTEPKKPAPRAAGGLLALTILGGAAIGTAYGQPTIGLLVGSALGILIALAFWVRDRKR